VFEWLFEGYSAVYLLLATAGVVLLVVWWRTRRRKYLVGVAAVAALAGAYFLLSIVKETDGRQIERKVREMAAGLQERRFDQTFSHISDEFRRGGRDKRALQQEAESVARRFDIREVNVWDIDVREISRERRAARVDFNVKAKGNWGGDEAFYRCEADFILDPDGDWRLRSFELFIPTTRQPAGVPF